MATELKPRTRRSKTDYKAKMDRLVMYCHMSVYVLDEINNQQPTEHLKGQITALKAVLKHLGASEAE